MNNQQEEMRVAIRSEAVLLAKATSVITVILMTLVQETSDNNTIFNIDMPRILFIFSLLGLASYWTSERPAGQGPDGDQVHRTSSLSLITRLFIDVLLIFSINLYFIYSMKRDTNETEMNVQTDYYLGFIPWTVKTPRPPGCKFCKTVSNMVFGMLVLAMIYTSYRAVLLAAMFLYKGVMSLMARDGNQGER